MQNEPTVQLDCRDGVNRAGYHARTMAQKARVAIYFDEDGYLEVSERVLSKGQIVGGPMGRHVAGKEFLTAYLKLARTQEFYGLARSNAHGKLMVEFCNRARADMPARKLYLLLEKGFHDIFFTRKAANLIHYPAPLEARMAWARQYDGGHAYALSGITHTICTANATRAMTQFVTTPYEPYDRMICISRAAVATVKSVVGAFCDFLADRYGGKPEMRLKLENIPLGVDIEKFRPATDEERAATRRKFGIAEDEVVVLYLGRLLHYGKVHPFPMFHGLSRAAKSTGKRVRLILAGWTPTEPVEKAFKDGAKAFAPGVQVTFLDGTRQDVRQSVWWAADIFSFPTDNVQETFPQSVIEAMSCGLPVVGANWDGCKDQVIEGETGYLIPTRILNGATAETTSKLLVGEYTYPHFMARVSQATAVDIPAAAKAFEKLILDRPLRLRMGAAGRQRALAEFAWEHIVRRYEDMWEEQEAERQTYIRQLQAPSRKVIAPSIYPAPEISFAEYPSEILEPTARVRAVGDAMERLDICLNHPLTNHGNKWRCSDPVQLRKVLEAARGEVEIAELVRLLVSLKTDSTRAQAGIMWMLKYDLLELV